MTVMCTFLTSEGAGFISDMRLVGEYNLLTDAFTKLWHLEGSPLVVGVAGVVGAAQQWLRTAQREGVSCIGELMDYHVPGEYHSLVYDAREHVLFAVDGQAAMIPVPEGSEYVQGSGEDFVRGYLAGNPDESTCDAERFERFARAIQQCSTYNLTVSYETDMLWMPRVKRAVARRRKSRRRASRSRK